MGTRTRTRPDLSSQPGKITREGFERLQKEAERLWNVERPKMTEAVATAAAEGDRSENAEYTYSKKKLGDIDRRLKFLGNRLKVLRVVDTMPPDDGVVHFGSWVTLEDDAGNEVRYRLVGSDEADVTQGFISVESPVGKALLGREEGDDVTVRRPKGEIEYCIVRVGRL